MGAAYFYHLTRRPLEAALPMLLERSLAAGWRVAVRGRDRGQLVALDTALWTGDEESFLPHGLSGGPHDADQPILLTDTPDLPNNAVCVMSVDGAEVGPEEVKTLERVCVLFDGHDPDAMQTARRQWKALSDAGCAAQYWSEESGRWEKKAESAGS
ncbi:DNA polymerase III subunit chi [Roseivivax marinus]|uniref:DNA polymerase III subunit chi n=1 Tax=Roseivivax marinus TaxID=1379903 RepID=W4HNY5_9RHOB|nr:DNA polymerase III subunit chi [Roseivivax marinus]ETW14452.1 DNA polymerase III subunit chi [Roseivivax marinus]